MGLKMTLSDRIIRLRKAKGLSQQEFSSRVGISRGAFQYYERGERDLPSTVLNDISKAFSDDPNRILNGEPSSKFMEILEVIVMAAFEHAATADKPIASARLWRVISRVMIKIYSDNDSLDDVKVDMEEIKELVEMVA